MSWNREKHWVRAKAVQFTVPREVGFVQANLQELSNHMWMEHGSYAQLDVLKESFLSFWKRARSGDLPHGIHYNINCGNIEFILPDLDIEDAMKLADRRGAIYFIMNASAIPSTSEIWDILNSDDSNTYIYCCDSSDRVGIEPNIKLIDTTIKYRGHKVRFFSTELIK